MSKQKRQKKRGYKQLLKRIGACKGCAYLAAATDLIRANQFSGNAAFKCPRCGRDLLVPMHPGGVGQEIFEKSLRAAGELMRDPEKPPPTHVRVLLNEQEIFSDDGVNNAGESDVVCTVKFQISDEEFAQFMDSQSRN